MASYREALEIDSSHVGARTALQAYLSNSDGELQRAAVKVLEPIYEANNDIARLVEVQRIKLGHEKKTEKRVDLLLRIGKLEGQLGNTDQAWEAYTRAVAESPASTPAREALENLANILDNWQPLVALYEKALSAKGKERLPSALERELLLVVAVAYDEKLAQSDRAVEYFRRAQSIQPEDASALVALERLYTRTERWSDLVDTLLKKAQLVTDAAEREEIRIRTARVWEEMLGNAEQAIVAWNVVLQDNPGNVQALRALDRLYMTRGEFRELADNLQRQLNLVAADPAETVLLLGRLGALREQHLGQLGAAVDTYSKILQIEPEHRETIAALERMLPSPEHEVDVAMLLEPIYKIRGDWPRLIGVYEVEARHTVDPEAKIALYKQIAEGYEIGLDDPGHAYEALARALAEDPQNPEVQTSTERLARALRRLDDLVARYGQLVESVADPERKNALYHKIARLAEADLGDDGQAAAAYLAALDVWPRDLEAANALEQLYLRRADYQNLVKLLLRKAEIVEDVAEKKTLYFRAAQLHEEVIEDLEAAVAVFQHVLSVDDGDKAALDQLERLYIRLARWNDLKNVYAKKAELATTPVEKKQMLFVLGQVYDRELGDPERAVETYSSIIDLDPEDYDAVAGARSPLSAARTLVRPARRPRAADGAGAVARRGGVAALPHRRAVARAPEGSGPRGRGVSPGPRHRSGARADDSRAGSADEGQGRAGAGGRRPRTDLRERGRVGSRDRGLRGDAGEQRRRGPHRRAAVAASPRSRSGGCRTRTRRSTSTAARCASTRTIRTCWRTWNGWRSRPGTGPSCPRCSPVRSRRSTNRGAPSICCCASRASTRRRPASSKRRSPPTGAPSPPIPTASRRWSRSTACSGARSSGTSSPRSSGARSGSPPATRIASR